ncbi:mitochondrial ATP synthase gamma subunit [Fusarium heterosporum]|uniref:Mitochondrial ATP synthase gamma subunit n=1 Tax=Fusarium heterosporum TaxID=42747 RepID=A0A8H5SX66_FUSHE|nr:mitochondrial ATP synthase gamma subunit [Fusarium heterosporum]
MAEVAGAVLGAIPLLINALERSAKIFGGRRTSQSKEFRTMQRATEQELIHFRNVLEILLDEILEPEQVIAMLEGPYDKMWNDPTFQAGVKAVLGAHADDFNALCLALHQKLMRVSLELGQFDGNHSGRSKRLKFSIQKYIKQDLQDSRRIMERLERLIHQSIWQSMESMLKDPDVNPALKKVESTREHAKLLCQVLSIGHATDLTMAIYPMASGAGKSISMFTLIFRHRNFEPVSPFGWRKAIVQISPAIKLPSRESGLPHKSEKHKSKANGNGVRSVHFKDNPTNSTRDADRSPEAVWVDSPEGFSRYFFDPEYNNNQQTTVCLRYPMFDGLISVDFCSCEDLHRVSLRDLLKIDPGIPRSARLALVVGLARAFLLFCGTGLMNGNLRSEYIWFTRDSNEILLGNLLLPVRNSDFQRTEKHQHRAPDNLTDPVKAFGRVLVMLGIILVEVLLSRQISSLDEGADVVSPETIKNALDGAKEIALEWGHSCSNAISHCLNNHELTTREKQDLFQERVLKPLEETLRAFSATRSAANAHVVLVQDWDRAISAPKDQAFPLELTDMSIQASPLTDPTTLRVFREYVASMCASCETIPWLSETVYKEGTTQAKYNP